MPDSISEIRKGLDMLFEPGDVVEMRVPRKKDSRFSSTISGFFYNMDALAFAIEHVNREYMSTVYVTMNPVRKSWMTVNNKCYVGAKTMRDELTDAGKPFEPRMKKGVSWETGKEHWSMRMTEDGDILRRKWILIDIDAGQPANTNSSAEEHEATLAMAKAVILALKDYGFPAPALTNSGNGHHVYVRVDLENTPDNLFLVRRFLKAVGQKFNGLFGTAAVDEGMFNAARITKACGTKVYKGEHTEERPQRVSHVINFADAAVTSRDLIEKVANEYTLKDGESLSEFTSEGLIVGEWLDSKYKELIALLDFYNVDYSHAIQNDDFLIMPCVCPNAEEHSMDGGELECIAGVSLVSGGFTFCCQHAHCQHLRSWRGFLKVMEEETGKKWRDEDDKGDLSMMTMPKKEIILENANPSKRVRAVLLLKELCKTECTVAEATTKAAALGISRQTLNNSYAAAGVVPLKGSDFVWRLVTKE